MSSLLAHLSEMESHETPFYFYDLVLLNDTLQQLQVESKGLPAHIHYALKANVNPVLLAEIKKHGLGADCVSGNEVKCALENGFSPDHVVFAGVGKAAKEIKYALENGIFSFNVESVQELSVLNNLAGALGCIARFSLRVNPNVDAGTHEYITTGKADNKFGITHEELVYILHRLPEYANCRFLGIHFHIGSQITEIHRFEELVDVVNDVQKELADLGIALPHLNVGGGLGIDYYEPNLHPMADFATYFNVFKRKLNLLPGQQLHFELGRSIVAACGSLISRVLYTKNRPEATFLILDAGMTELIRPALYKAYHHIENLSSQTKNLQPYHVVGPICESSDQFGKNVYLPATEPGHLLAIRSSGAYGEIMASRYNLRELAPALFWNGYSYFFKEHA